MTGSSGGWRQDQFVSLEDKDEGKIIDVSENEVQVVRLADPTQKVSTVSPRNRRKGVATPAPDDCPSPGAGVVPPCDQASGNQGTAKGILDSKLSMRPCTDNDHSIVPTGNIAGLRINISKARGVHCLPRRTGPHKPSPGRAHQHQGPMDIHTAGNLDWTVVHLEIAEPRPVPFTTQDRSGHIAAERSCCVNVGDRETTPTRSYRSQRCGRRPDHIDGNHGPFRSVLPHSLGKTVDNYPAIRHGWDRSW
ncbi:MAG: hypothetical protein NVS3B21_03260 [Acidimicrobiales bacterium]